MYANKILSFVVNIQGTRFQINALIVNNLTGIDLLLGTETLKELEGILDFKTNCFHIKPSKTFLRPTNKVILYPGQSKYVNLQGRIPAFARNSEIVVHPTQRVSHTCPSAMLVKLRKGRTRILLRNNATKPFVVSPSKSLAYLNLANIVTVTQELPQELFDVCSYTNEVNPSQSDNVNIRSERENVRESNLKRYPHLNENDPIASMTESEIIRKFVDLDKSILTPSERSQVYELLQNYRHAFSLYGELSNCPNFEANITLTNDEPFFIRPYKLSEQDKQIVAKELDKLVKLGILAVGHQPYTSPVFLIPKKGSHDKRVVTDFRYLNNRIKRINHPFPLLNETLRTIGNSGATVLSVIDLKSAFYCLPLSEKSQQYTGIASYSGGKHYYYRRLPQGLNLSPALFQAKIDEILETIPNSLQYCIAHHDDIIVFSADKESHSRHLQGIFKTLISHGLKISPKKCSLFRNSVHYMGHLISINDKGEACIQPLNDRCSAIRNTPVPHNIKSVRRFVGAVNYVSAFFPNVQAILRPLHKLSRKRKDFEWTSEHQKAFNEIKELMCQPPILHMPQRNGKFILYSDTSRVATGSYLTQKVNGKEHIIGYYSKVLPQACQRYSVTELELFGLLINVTAFKYLLKSIEFEAYVDHSAIVDMLKSKQEPPTARISKLLLKLSEYTFKVGYKKGAELVLADYLSRAPLDGDSEIDKILPVASPFSSDPESESHLYPVLTRSKAKALGIKVPDIFPTKSVTRGQAKQNSAPPVLPSPPVVARQQEDSNSRENIPLPPLSRSQLATVPPPNVSKPTPLVRQPLVDLPFLPEFSDVQPSQSEPRLVDKGKSEERISNPPPHLFVPPLPLVPKIDKLVTGHIPKQKELHRVMRNIQRKIIRDYNLPFDVKELQIQQETCPHFKPIYDYLAHDILPNNVKSARTVCTQAEQYLLCNGLLFRIFLHDKDDNKMTLQLVIPDTMIAKVISKYHDDLLSNHQGVMRTYLTIRQYFYMRNMFQCISNYIQACLRCQEFRGKPDKVRQFHARIPDSYRPFDKISLDFKYMPLSVTGFKHLMVACDEITRFVICVPLKTLDAETICEAILQKIVTTFGPPSCLITDAAASLTGKLVELLCRTLGIDQKVISVMNHGSLQVERHIQTLSNFLKVNLNQFGNDWVRFVPTAAYAYNSFSSPHLGNHSPYELVFGRKPANLTNLTFNPMSGLSHSYGEYAELLKKRFDHLSQTMLKLQKRQQDAQNVKITKQLAKSPIYSVGQLVYLYKPTSSSLTANSRKISAEWCGPLVVHEVLDRTHYILATLTGQILHDVFNYNRLKPCFVRASSETKNITNVNKLKDVLKQNDNNVVNMMFDSDVIFHDENDNILPVITSHDIFCSTCTEPIVLNSYVEHSSQNKGLAVPYPLEKQQIARQLNLLNETPQENMFIQRARYKHGQLQVLVSLPRVSNSYSFWWNVSSYADTENIVNYLMENRVQITGAPHKMFEKLFL